MKIAHYLYFFLWRLCRGSRDPAFGDLRVHILLILIEVNILFGAVQLTLRDLSNVNRTVYVLLMAASILLFNYLLFSDKAQRAKYFRLFADYAPRERFLADAAVVVFCISAVAFPFVAMELTD